MKLKRLIGVFLFAFLAFTLSVSAQNENNKKFRHMAQPSKVKVKKGDKFLIRLSLDFDKYWYTYSMKPQENKEGIGPNQTEIVIKSEDLLKMDGNIIAPKPHRHYDKGFEMDIDYYNGKFYFDLPVVAKKNIDFSKDKVHLELYLQQCDTARCLPPMPFDIIVSDQAFAAAETKDEDIKVDVDEKSPEEVKIVEKPDSASEQTEVIVQNDNDQNNEAKGGPAISQGKSDEKFMTDDRKEAEERKREGVLSYLLFAMSFGFLGLLTPCVYPMIPITVSYFTKKSEKQKGKGLRDASLYALGIISTFTALGIVVAALAGPAGLNQMASNPWLNIGLTTLFVIFALNLFGAFEIQVPTGLINKLNIKSQKSGGIGGVILMGLIFSLTSFTCTVPFVGIVLTDTASGQWFYPIVGMLGYSFIFAVPFFFLALFPSLISKLPKSGGWMNNMKVVMGFLEVAFAMKFLSNVDLAWGLGIMPKNIFLSIWIGAGILIVVYLLGFYKMKLDSPVDRIGGIRIMFTIVFATMTIYLISGLFGSSLGKLDAFLPPPTDMYNEIVSGAQTKDEVKVDIKPEVIKNDVDVLNSSKIPEKEFDNYEKAKALAIELKRPIFIDFTGVTCTNCRYMETNMFSRPAIKNRLKNFVKVKLYTDRNIPTDRANQEMQRNRFNTVTLPLYVILTPDGKKIATHSYTDDEKDFKAFLDKGINTKFD